jgi:hypothetical protein
VIVVNQPVDLAAPEGIVRSFRAQLTTTGEVLKLVVAILINTVNKQFVFDDWTTD